VAKEQKLVLSTTTERASPGSDSFLCQQKWSHWPWQFVLDEGRQRAAPVWDMRHSEKHICWDHLRCVKIRCHQNCWPEQTLSEKWEYFCTDLQEMCWYLSWSDRSEFLPMQPDFNTFDWMCIIFFVSRIHQFNPISTDPHAFQQIRMQRDVLKSV